MALAMEEFRRLLAERGYRVTAQRLAIYELLQENARRCHHPSAEELYQQARERFPMISPATVYNTLELLVELGLASQLGFPGDVQRYDGNPHAHANVQCISCKEIFDVDAEALEGIGQRVAERSDFVILGQRFEFYGICPRCQQARRQGDGAGKATGRVQARSGQARGAEAPASPDRSPRRLEEPAGGPARGRGLPGEPEDVQRNGTRPGPAAPAGAARTAEAGLRAGGRNGHR